MTYAILFSLGCFLLACFGASIVFFIKKSSNSLNVFMHAFASGIMVASSIFSIIISSLNYCHDLTMPKYLVLPICFLVAGITFFILEFKQANNQETGKINTLSLSIGFALHNIPEGMCLGFAFASFSHLGTHSALMSAIMIAVGIGVQNIPEGSSIAFPLYSKGVNKRKSFFCSISIAFVEVIACIVSFFIGSAFVYVLPFMLAFAGATMLIVAIFDLMPEAISINKTLAYVFFLLGFILMMVLSLILG